MPMQTGHADATRFGSGQSIGNLPVHHGPLRVGRFFCGTAILALALLGQTAFAQSQGTVQPGAIQREFEKPAEPKSLNSIAVPGPQSPVAPEQAEKIRFTLKEVRFAGNTAVPTTELQALAAPFLGKDVSLATIYALSNEVTKLYTQRGFALSIGVVPAQEISDGTVGIDVVEGYVDTVKVSGDGLRSDLRSAMEQTLTQSRPLRTADLERALLLVDDLPGVTITSIFERSEAGRGATTLNVTVARKTVEGSIGINNRGSEALGPLRADLNLAFNNVIGAEERISLTGVRTLASNELAYVTGRIEVPLSQRLTIFAEGSYSDSKPGTRLLSLLEYMGSGYTLAAGLTYSAIRSRATNLSVTSQFTYKNLKTDVLGFPFSHDKLSVGEVRLDFDRRDGWNGVSQVMLRLARGFNAFGSTRLSDPLRSRFSASGNFFLGEATLARIQSLGQNASLYVQVTGQLSDRPLLTSEQCGYGGGLFGRAFDSFEISGDRCIKAAAELRYDLPSFIDDQVRLQVYAFGDAGWIGKRGPLGLGEVRTAHAQSVGGGLRAWFSDKVSAGIEAAVPLNRGVALSNNSKKTRVFGFIAYHF